MAMTGCQTPSSPVWTVMRRKSQNRREFVKCPHTARPQLAGPQALRAGCYYGQFRPSSVPPGPGQDRAAGESFQRRADEVHRTLMGRLGNTPTSLRATERLPERPPPNSLYAPPMLKFPPEPSILTPASRFCRSCGRSYQTSSARRDGAGVGKRRLSP